MQNNIGNQEHTTDENGLPEYILGYKIEREYGDKNIEDCIKEIILHSLNIKK